MTFAIRRDFRRAALFRCSTPFRTALSRALNAWRMAGSASSGPLSLREVVALATIVRVALRVCRFLTRRRSEVRADIGILRADISTLRADVTALRERMARMEALILQSAVAGEARASEAEGAPVTPVPGSASCRLAFGGEDDLADVVALVHQLMRFHELG